MERKLVGLVGVDTGQIFMTDPAYLKDWQHGEYLEDQEPDNSYARVTTCTIGHGYGEVEHGVAVGTGGDGSFPGYVVEDERGNIVKIEVDLSEMPSLHRALQDHARESR